MFKILGRIPKTHFHVACSGGTDSMVLVDYLKKWPKNQFDILHFNHGTEYCDEAEQFIKKYCKDNNIECHVGHIKNTKPSKQSKEEFWRNNRYEFLSKFSGEPILMAHQLRDVIETWVMTSMTGNPKLIPYYNKKYNIFRPFLCVPKKEIENWSLKHKVQYVIDKSNFDTSIKRNYVRYEVLHHIYKINPGIEKSITKLILADFEQKGLE